ncbi:hypothetical protein CIT292_09842 [Citrobacter youngae ATCC 29220]|uniref:Uncharacterized protein n=1 Tax=Citrobacter youngae ATCC 29220 TaxID=500640 RepID=D4BH35_9ENTR|nr:hypothetical protein CIT292_09842 [Citrobacter youngae ATCC 29220]
MFPAPAGINRKNQPGNLILTSVPRASGDKPPLPAFLRFFEMCSPRQRG